MWITIGGKTIRDFTFGGKYMCIPKPKGKPFLLNGLLVHGERMLIHHPSQTTKLHQRAVSSAKGIT